MNKFYERIKELRIEKGLSQTQLAKQTKLSQSAIAFWECGQRVPGAEAIIILSRFFGVTTDYLLGEED